MNAVVRTSAFKSGNSVAVRLPKGFGIKAGEQIELAKNGPLVSLKRVEDPEIEKAKVKELVRILRELGPVEDVQHREPIEFPDRPGLY